MAAVTSTLLQPVLYVSEFKCKLLAAQHFIVEIP